MTPAVPDPTVEALSEAEREAVKRAFMAARQMLGTLPATIYALDVAEAYTINALAARAAAPDALRARMEALADEFDAKGRRGSAHFGADIGDTIRLWIERDPRKAEDGAQ